MACFLPAVKAGRLPYAVTFSAAGNISPGSKDWMHSLSLSSYTTKMYVYVLPVEGNSSLYPQTGTAWYPGRIWSVDYLQLNNFWGFLWRLICGALNTDSNINMNSYTGIYAAPWLQRVGIESPYMMPPLTRFVQPGKIEIDANEMAVLEMPKLLFRLHHLRFFP